MSAVIIRFSMKPEPTLDKPRYSLTSAEFSDRARLLRQLAAEWGLAVTVHGPAGGAARH